MHGSTHDSAEYWRSVMQVGGVTSVPRWAREPSSGTARHEEPVPDDLWAGYRTVAESFAVPEESVLLAVHALVLSTMTGEREVAIGCPAPEHGQILPVRIEAGRSTWRALLQATSQSLATAMSYAQIAVQPLRAELGVPCPFETVVTRVTDLTGPRQADPRPDDLPPGIAVSVAEVARGDDRFLRFTYRTEVLDAEAITRLAGYHRQALRYLVMDPQADPRSRSLLSAEERDRQLFAMAGPNVPLPDRRVHELFQDRAHHQPQAIAAIQGERRWTYRELNGRANRLGRALRAQGLHREQIVAVSLERNLEWLAAVLAIFKAGGAYLPIEPHVPVERVGSILDRSGCAVVLTESASRTAVDEAVRTRPDVSVMSVEELWAEEHDERDLDLPVEADQLAYLLFTSGSTGQPKGAMCEHAGMLNHLYAKIMDLRIADGEVVPQTGPQSFDISVWQLLAGLLVGGSTLIVEQDVVLDVERLVDTLVTHRAGVLQVVPSYLDAVVGYLEQDPRPLPDLHTLCPTGDLLKKDLVRRWFAIQPQIPVVNTYGLTETSDDAVHAVLSEVPAAARIPLGRPIINTPVYITDEDLQPVPLGAPGMIVFGGVCVGRGYVNDPERTAVMFRPDPHRPGGRVCVTGDHGRWLPDGTLDFLGRRDTQVKIRGFRIEIGDVENALSRVEGVRDGAVVVVDHGLSSARLVGFYSTDLPVSEDAVLTELAGIVPGYLVPSAVHRRQSLPLTANGKIDRRALVSLAGELSAAQEPSADHHPPETETEHTLAAAWSRILGVAPERIGRQDHFFDLGGTSMSAVKLAITLQRAVSLQQITRFPVLAELATVMDDGVAGTGDDALLQRLSEPGGPVTGTLICFPYGGGNAVNFQPMAQELGRHGIRVIAVELPGHDLAAVREPFVPLPRVVASVVDEILDNDLGPVMLWGHSAGAAFALATAHALISRQAEVPRIFLAAQLLGDPATRRTSIGELERMRTEQIATWLTRARGYTELETLDEAQADQVGAAYRHDVISAHRYLAEILESPVRMRLRVPATVIVAEDDTATTGYEQRVGDWRTLVEDAEFRVLESGGHYFSRTRPQDCARIVARSVPSARPVAVAGD
jgi:amino acid adenylation domain-containing protein